MLQGYDALTDREKQTLRLLLDGHDAKSIARLSGLSVYTINERLRDARRKFSVSSSREAARLLKQAEDVTTQSTGDKGFGEARPAEVEQPSVQPHTASRSRRPMVWAIGGLAMILLTVALLALSPPDGTRFDAPSPDGTLQSPATETAVTKAARNWLALVDEGRWEESLAAAGGSFRSLNTVAAWRSASERVRTPLGKMKSRRLLDESDIPAPPNGYRMVRFRTDFANRSDVTETLSLDREGDDWKVVGIYIG